MKSAATPEDEGGRNHGGSQQSDLLPPATEKALTALEDARHELATEEGLVVMDAAAPEEGFVLNHERVIRRIDEALAPFAGQYDATINPQ